MRGTMNQAERRLYLIRALLDENPRYRDMEIPRSVGEQKRLLRSLMNVWLPAPIGEDFLTIQDEYLKEANREKGITRLSDLEPVEEDLYLWQGDITAIECDAIVNAANSQMLGCFSPCHGCIDNAIPYSITHRPMTSFRASA